MRASERIAASVFLVLVWIPSILAAEGSMPYEAFSRLTVGSVTVEGAPMSREEVSLAVPLAEGEPFRPTRLAEGIRNLYRTGRFRQVTALGNVQDGRLHVRIVLEPKRQVRRFVFQGNLRVSEAELRRLLALGLESDVTAGKLDDAVVRMREHYAFRGFRDASVAYEILPPERGRSDVVFAIREGSRDLVADVRLEADAGFSRLRLLSLISMVPGDAYDGRRIDRDVASVARHLKEDGYYFPDVSAEVSDESGGRTVTFTVRRNRRFILRAEADAARAGRRIRRWMEEVFKASDSQEKAMKETEKRVREDYLSRGYSFASLQWTTLTGSRGEEAVSLKVVPGPPTVIGSVSVVGATHFPPGRLETILGLTEGQPFLRSAVDDALSRLEKQYLLEGYPSVAVRQLPLSFTQEAQGRPMAAHVQASVTEGDRRTLGRITVEGGPYAADEVLDITGLSTGGPYSTDLLFVGRDRLVEALARAGYAYASVSVEPSAAEGGASDVRVRIAEGPLLRVGRTLISGNERTDERIVRLAGGIERGATLTTQTMLESKENLYDLRIFSSAEVRVVDAEEPGTPKDVLVDLVERPRYVFGLKVGYGSEDHLRGEASVTDRNVGGMARSLTLLARGSDIERFVSLTYGHPWYLGRRMDFTGMLSDLVEERQSYTRDALSASVNLNRKVSDRTTANLGYSFEGLRLLNVSSGAQLSPDDAGKTDLAMVQPELIYDSRDDVLDPSSGMLGDLKLELAWTGFGSEAEYSKAELAHRRYLPLGSGVVGAYMLRAGFVRSYGRSSEVIISKRFFLGGFNSVRGYPLDGVGPKGTGGDPVGGNFMVNANFEARFPLYRSLRGILFVDTGGLWLERQTYEEEALRVSAGAGLRWSSPIGPFSLDYGYKVNPSEADTADRYRVHFSIGQAF